MVKQTETPHQLCAALSGRISTTHGHALGMKIFIDVLGLYAACNFGKFFSLRGSISTQSAIVLLQTPVHRSNTTLSETSVRPSKPSSRVHTVCRDRHMPPWKRSEAIRLCEAPCTPLDWRLGFPRTCTTCLTRPHDHWTPVSFFLFPEVSMHPVSSKRAPQLAPVLASAGRLVW